MCRALISPVKLMVTVREIRLPWPMRFVHSYCIQYEYLCQAFPEKFPRGKKGLSGKIILDFFPLFRVLSVSVYEDAYNTVIFLVRRNPYGQKGLRSQ